MKYEELLAKYQALLLENANLKRQIELLEAASIPADSTGQEADGDFASGSVKNFAYICGWGPA